MSWTHYKDSDPKNALFPVEWDNEWQTWRDARDGDGVDNGPMQRWLNRRYPTSLSGEPIGEDGLTESERESFKKARQKHWAKCLEIDIALLKNGLE
jgi:hypothetical protein